jgi:hypothetical protein
VSRFFQLWLLVDFTYHGVLAHQDDSLTTEGVSDLVHLLRGDIVDGDDEDGAVLFEQALELVEVAGFVSSLAPHIFLLDEGRMFQGKDILFRRELARACVMVLSQTNKRAGEICHFVR